MRPASSKTIGLKKELVVCTAGDTPDILLMLAIRKNWHNSAQVLIISTKTKIYRMKF